MSAIAADVVVPQWQNYVDLKSDVKPWLQIPSTDTGSDVMLQLVIDSCCAWVQSYLGRPVVETELFRRFNGVGSATGAFIMLPFAPVLSIVSIVETWGLNGQHTLTYQTPASQGGAGQQMFQVDWITGMLIRTYQGLIQRPWFPGSSNVEVTWTAGYNPIPAQIKIATLEMIAYWWRNTQQASISAPMPAGMEYDSLNASTANSLWPAVPHRVTAMLEPYVQVGVG